MAKLSFYVGQVKRLNSGGHERNDQPWDDREIGFALGQERDKAIWLKSMNDGKVSEHDMVEIAQGLLTTFYNLPVLSDEERCLWYVPLMDGDNPLDWVKGMPNDMGLFMLSPMKAMKSAYRKLTPSFLALYAGNPAIGLAGDGGYWPEIVDGQRRLYLHNHGKGSPTEFMVQIIPVIDGTNMDLDVNMPADMASDVVTAVVRRYTVAQPQDTSNNSNTSPA